MVDFWNAGKSMTGLVRRGRATTLLMSGCLAVAMLFGFCGESAPQQAKDKPSTGGAPMMPPPEVEVAQATMKALPRVAESVGRVESSNTVEVRARVEGFLEGQLFADGALVKKDQPLFRIESKQYVVALNQAKADQAKAKATLNSAKKGVDVLKAKAELIRTQAERIKAEKDLARIKPLVEADASSRQELDAAQASFDVAKAVEEALQAAYQQAQIDQETAIELAEASVKSAEATLALAELKLSYTDVASPIDGQTGKAQHLPGALVGKDMASPTLLVTVSATDPMWANWTISEREYLALMAGDANSASSVMNMIKSIEMILADGSVYPATGQMNFVDRAIDLKTGTLAVRAEFPNPNGLLREGQYCRIRLTRQPRTPDLMIPQRAVQELQGESFVFVVDAQGAVEQRKIEAGERVGSEQVVSSGLKEGEGVIIGGIQKVRPGITVKPVESQGIVQEGGGK